MTNQGAGYTDHAYFFGPFALSIERRLLLEDGQPVRLGSRALEMLILLVERCGELVSKQELRARVWPATVVVEGNLTAQMTTLRRTLRDSRLGSRYIVNEPGRGYRFVAPVSTSNEREEALPKSIVQARFDRLSPSFRRLVELCYGFAEPSLKQEAPPQDERAKVDAILQSGIRALEVARVLVANSDHAREGGAMVRVPAAMPSQTRPSAHGDYHDQSSPRIPHSFTFEHRGNEIESHADAECARRVPSVIGRRDVPFPRVTSGNLAHLGAR
jgi:DNA-binding winged helix-turn-helix (wHTH) protein